jgi:hypothetical protein
VVQASEVERRFVSGGTVRLELDAGDVTIGVGSRDQYRYVNASVKVGELNADPFNVNKDGLFRSFEW